MKTRIVKTEDGKYKRIDSSKCGWGQTPGITPCGLITCKQECVVEIPVENVPKRWL